MTSSSSNSNPFSTDTVRNAINAAAEFVGRSKADAFRGFATYCGPRRDIQSPIEAVFWVWWNALDSLSVQRSEDLHHFILEAQHAVTTSDGLRYRLDFAIVDFRIAVELDGHEFHERTPEQVAYRNTRDRHLHADGWQVFHISGSELWRHPYERVSELYALCCDKADSQICARARAGIA